MIEQPTSALYRFVEHDDPDSLTLVVDTPQGPHLRRIPPALPLPSHIDPGPGAEAAAHHAAATWGMPDFVFQQAAHATKGSGRRELGDRLLLSGRRDAVVQVKARTIPPKPDAQEAAWIQKVAAKAMSQAKGTVRQLRMAPAEMLNGRNRAMGVDGTNAHLTIRVMLEDIALSMLDDSLTEANRFSVLSDLDRLPVTARAEWGHLLLDMLRDVPHVPDEHCKWRFRRMLHEDGTHQLIVGAATRFDAGVRAAFSAYVQLRHHEVTARTGRTEEASTLGVLLTPRHDGSRPWDTSTVRVHGDLELSEEELSAYSEAWNRTTEDGAVGADI
ncbi:hypothetical protein ABZW03_27255 [Kitasatospora sp. NPDC004799]|uniref:hypothetical protein n=1 Tax=Kitasatospora sp. NPDC004799 TaxID=3154460 RepID=UPI0033A71C88